MIERQKYTNESRRFYAGRSALYTAMSDAKKRKYLHIDKKDPATMYKNGPVYIRVGNKNIPVICPRCGSERHYKVSMTKTSCAECEATMTTSNVFCNLMWILTELAYKQNVRLDSLDKDECDRLLDCAVDQLQRTGRLMREYTDKLHELGREYIGSPDYMRRLVKRTPYRMEYINAVRPPDVLFTENSYSGFSMDITLRLPQIGAFVPCMCPKCNGPVKLQMEGGRSTGCRCRRCGKLMCTWDACSHMYVLLSHYLPCIPDWAHQHNEWEVAEILRLHEYIRQDDNEDEE